MISFDMNNGQFHLEIMKQPSAVLPAHLGVKLVILMSVNGHATEIGVDELHTIGLAVTAVHSEYLRKGNPK